MLKENLPINLNKEKKDIEPNHKKEIEKLPREERVEKKVNQFTEIVLEKFPEKENQEKILKALNLMLELHGDQEDRKDGRPYVLHTLAAGKNVLEWLNNDHIDIKNDKFVDLVIAGLLHDSVEDQNIKLFFQKLEENYPQYDIYQEEIRDWEKYDEEKLKEVALSKIEEMFGEKARDLIKDLSNPDFDSLFYVFPKAGEEEEKYKARKKKFKNLQYLQNVAFEMKEPEVFVIKLGDFMDNVSHIRVSKQERLAKKYGPVINKVILPKLRALEEDHILYSQKKKLIKKLVKIYHEDMKPYLNKATL